MELEKRTFIHMSLNAPTKVQQVEAYLTSPTGSDTILLPQQEDFSLPNSNSSNERRP